MMLGAIPTLTAAAFGTEYTEPETDALPPNTIPFSVIRLNTNGTDWGAISPSDGVFTGWTTFDSIVAAFRAAGAKIHYVVGNQNGASPTPPSYVTTGNLVTKYGAFVDALLSHAGTSLDYLTVWNEPDAASLITGQGDPHGTLKTLAQTLASKVAAYNTANGTSIKILGPSVSGADDGTSRLTMLQTFCSNGAAASVDIIDFHGYVNSVLPERMIGVIQNVRQARDKYGYSTKPIWITEYGTSDQTTPALNDRISYAAKVALWAVMLGVSGLSYFAYNYAHFNMWDATNGVNGVGTAWGELNKWLTGAAAVAYSQTSGICYVDIVRPGGYRARAIWTADRSTPSYAVPNWANQYHKLDGTVTTGLGGSGNVTLGFVPILLESGQAW